MIYRAKHFKRTLLYVAYLLIWAPTQIARAQEIYYFSDHARDLEVSADSESLLTFPAPPFARVCQPSGIVDLYPVDGAGDLDAFLVPRGMQNGAATGLPTAGSTERQTIAPESDQLARHLKIVPKRSSGSALCAIRLTNEQVVNVRFVLSKMVSKPIIEFRSVMEKARSGAVLSQALGPINLFRSLVSGGDLAFLADETPSDEIHTGRSEPTISRKLTKSTVSAHYRLLYVGTDKDLYKAWKFEGTAERDLPTSQPLRDPRLGEIYFSAFIAKTTDSNSKAPVSAKKQIHKGDDFTFYVLTRGDISPSEMMERLP